MMPIENLQQNLPKITFNTIEHRGNKVILIIFEKNKFLIERVKKLVGVKWSKTHRSWYVLDNEFYRQKFKIPLENIIDKTQADLSPDNAIAWQSFIKLLQLKAYSPSTIKTYSSEFLLFLKTLKSTAANSLTKERINDYFHYCITKLKLSENQLHSRINAIKFYYQQVLQLNKIEVQFVRPKKAKQLPKIMSVQDVQNLLSQVKNKKHYFILALTYGTGLRLSEIVNLKLSNIDINRNTLFIERAKGKKDRVVGFPKSLLQVFATYKLEFKPKHYLFEGQYGGQYSPRSIQEIFQNAKQLAGIENAKGIHGFRHSYATHLHEAGTDISTIQKLLGHNSIKTTMIYTHISKKEIENVISPLDHILKNNYGNKF